MDRVARAVRIEKPEQGALSLSPAFLNSRSVTAITRKLDDLDLREAASNFRGMVRRPITDHDHLGLQYAGGSSNVIARG
jgi:hypothetical protein